MSRKTTPAPELKEAPVSHELVAQGYSAANELAVQRRESEAHTRAVAQQLGYQLPADCADPDLIQRDIAANMRRSVEACLEVGRGLAVLKAACKHGEFLPRLDALNIDVNVAGKFMQTARRFTNSSTSMNLAKAAGTQSKLFELLVLDDEQIEELELFGQTGELALDDVARMGVRELRAALREAKAEKSANDELLTRKQARIDKLEREAARVKRLPPDEQLLLLQQKATATMHDVSGCLVGGLRQAIIAVRNHSDLDHTPFLAGLLGQLQVDLVALREEFQVPDISTVAEAELAAEVAQWAPKKR